MNMIIKVWKNGIKYMVKMDKYVLIQIIIVLNNNLNNIMDFCGMRINFIIIIISMKQHNNKNWYLIIKINLLIKIKILNMLKMLLNKDKKLKLKMILLQDGWKIKTENNLNK